jgi:hypothetical protein
MSSSVQVTGSETQTWPYPTLSNIAPPDYSNAAMVAKSGLGALAGVSGIFGPVSQATSLSNTPPPPSSPTAPPVTSAIALPPITGTTAPPISVTSAPADDSSDDVGGPDDGVDPNNSPGPGLGPGFLSPPPKKRAARMQA